MKDQTRNLNPHAEAEMAMIVYGYEYSKSGKGSMDFWDSLSDSRKYLMSALVDHIKENDNRACQQETA